MQDLSSVDILLISLGKKIIPRLFMSKLQPIVYVSVCKFFYTFTSFVIFSSHNDDQDDTYTVIVEGEAR